MGFGDLVTPGRQFGGLGGFPGRAMGGGDRSGGGGGFADIIRIRQIEGRLEVVRMEFGSLVALVGNVSEDNGTTGMSTGNHFEVSGGQDRSLEFRKLSSPNVYVIGLGEVPQDACLEAAIKPTCTVSISTSKIKHIGS